MKPKLWPLIKRFGISQGIARWLNCGLHGHDWHALPNGQYREGGQLLPNGLHVIHGRSKVRCTCCESIKIIRLIVVIHPDGSVTASSPDGQII